MTTPAANGKLSLNLELLIKLLKLTTSSNDSEALLACRKANEQLAKFGGDWEALLHSKVTVIADPFSAPPPTMEQVNRRPAAPPPPAPPRPTPPPPRPQPRPQAAAQTPPHPQAAARNPYTFTAKKHYAAPKPQPQPAATRNTLRKQRVQLDDLA